MKFQGCFRGDPMVFRGVPEDLKGISRDHRGLQRALCGSRGVFSGSRLRESSGTSMESLESPETFRSLPKAP